MTTVEPQPLGASAASRRDVVEPEHFVQFDEQDAALVASVCAYARAALEQGAAAVLIPTSSHREAIERLWRSEGFDPSAALETGQLVIVDAAEALGRISREGLPERSLFLESIGSIIVRALRRFTGVAAFGEMVALLWKEGRHQAAVDLESLWNELLKERAFTLYCAYPLDGSTPDAAPFAAVCREHGRIIPAESYTSLPPRERLRAISELQRLARTLEREVPRREAAESRLAAREHEAARLAAIVESSDDAILSKTLDGTIQTWNGAATRLFGFSAEEAIGRCITLIVPPERLGEEREILARLRRGERVSGYETLALAKDGRRVPVSLTVSPVRDSAGGVVASSIIARDITELRQAREALRDADRRKDEFLALLAHELRNPLAPIRYAVAMSANPGCTAELRTRADEIIGRQVRHMSRLLDDLLDVSRIGRGMVELRRRVIDLGSVLAAAIETARPLIEAKRHALVLDLPRRAVRLRADPVRLAQVFTNLLINAAKYTDPGGRIALETAREGREIVVTVRDNGIGIPEELKSQLFTLFAQARPALEHAEGGLGIGLALVRGLVALHGGSVEAHSAGPGLGSAFIVRLPVSEAAGQSDPEGPVSAGGGRPLRLVVADDNRDSAETCAALLELSGHAVEIAHDGRRALELAEQLRPDALVLDIGMPELNGYEVAERIRAAAWGRRMMLIAVSGWGQEEDRRRASEAGFDHHLTKPLDPDALGALLRSLGGGTQP